MTSLQRAIEMGRSGVYRVDAARRSALEVLARGAGRAFHRVDLSGATGKAALLSALARELRFPEWFGGNWDALQDALCDLSWLPQREGVVLLIDGAEAVRAAAPAALDTLVDVLQSAARYWKGEGRPFLALVANSPDLPALR